MGKRSKRSKRTVRNGSFTYGRSPRANISRSVSEGIFRLRDTLTLSSSSGGNLKQVISRSYTQFAEAKSLEAIFTEVKLIAFECSISPAQYYAKTDTDETKLSFGWMCIGTNPMTTITAPTTGDGILAQSDSREFFLRNMVKPFNFRSLCLKSGYKFTPFASETSYAFAGSPGSIFVGNMLANSEQVNTDLMYVIITGVYAFTGRTV